MNKGFATGWLVLVIVVLAAIAAGTYFYIKQTHPSVTNNYLQQISSTTPSGKTSVKVASPSISAATTPTTVQLAAQQQLIADLSNVTPQFVSTTTGSDGTQILSSALQKIEYDVVVVDNYGSNPYTGGPTQINVYAIGKRYVAVSVPGPGDGASTQILDSVTLKSNYLSGPFQLQTNKVAVFVSPTDICTYKPDQALCIPLPGAKLTGKEVYGDDQNSGNYLAPQDATITDTSLTIAVLTWVMVPSDNPQVQPPHPQLQKVREATYTLP